MIYKLAAPLTFFFQFSFVYLALQIWRDRNNAPTDRTTFAIVASFVVLISIVGFQLKTYASIKADRQEGLLLKQEIVTEMNQIFPDKLLVFDFFRSSIGT